MDFRQLEIFAAVIELNSFSRASEKLYLSQPTVSAHILSLEKELGVPLIIRNTRELYPSEHGQKLYEYATQLLAMREEAIEQVGAKNKAHEGIISIAASTIPAKHILPALISGFRRQYPAITFNIIPCDSSSVCSMLVEGKAKIGFGGAVMSSELCRHYAIATDRLVLITPNNEYYAKFTNDESSFAALLKEPFIMRPAGSGTRHKFEQYLLSIDHHEPLDIAAEMEDTEAIKISVQAGMGIAVISALAAEDEVRAGRLKVFSLPGGGERDLYLIRRKKDRLAERERMFCTYVLDRAFKI